MYLIFDTETTGLPKNWDALISDTDNWPRCVQIAWQLHDEMGRLLEHQNYLILPDGFNVPYDAEKVHGISTDLAKELGKPLSKVLIFFKNTIAKSKFIVGQNLKFDVNIIGCEFYRLSMENPLKDMVALDTCSQVTADICKIKGGRAGKYKFPTLMELYSHLFNKPFLDAHNATADVEATARCFLELIRIKAYTAKDLNQDDSYFTRFNKENTSQIKPVGIKHLNLKKESKKISEKKSTEEKKNSHTRNKKVKTSDLYNVSFSHLHNHSQFSVLQSTSSIDEMLKVSIEEKMPAVAITDTGNMMGVFYFVQKAYDYNKSVTLHNENLVHGQEPKNTIIPIVGCELNICENHLDKTRKDNGYQVVMLAKNKRGFHHLAKLSSIGFIEGFYYVPRIDKEVVKKYKDDVIVLSGNLYGEIPGLILNKGEKQAEDALLWWKEQFGDDFYLELMRHGQENEDYVNKVLLKFSKKHNVKIVATNNTFYTYKDQAKAHDILLCVKDGEKISTPKGSGRGYRYGLPNQEYYFKSQGQMKSLFSDIPEAISNIQQVVDKIQVYTLARDVVLPKFKIPSEFIDAKDNNDREKTGENAYLKHLTYVGAKKRYPEINSQIKQRIDFELKIIEKTGYPGYFLIVQDFISQAVKMQVSVGPGRGSVAGSTVAYCLGITNIDPIKYNLLFERFLNPDRVSMPDIDIDFDDEGRQRVIDYVIEKYGSSQVAQIITYGTMAAKSSIRDTARVLDLPLHKADRIAKLIPGIKLKDIFSEDEKSKKKILELREEERSNIGELKEISKQSSLEAQTIKQALSLEGSIRNTGIHACGVIITPEDITNLVPVCVSKDNNMYVTQFDNNVVESAGLLKMDFLGLKTLTLIKDTIKLIKEIHGISLVADDFPLDDAKTYELFQRGETIGIFQYESAGMQKYMKSLKPTVFEDLIAMNALYRPGPMEYIPSFIRRKHKEEEITYNLAEMEEYLKETYGITVYQEQVMLLSQKLAGFTKGQADILRKAMGKKIFSLLDELKPKFINGGKENGHSEEILEKIWKDWEAFAAYAFNKSHSTCYAYIAYQTAYLKSHYPAEYMAAVLSNNMNDIKQVSFFMEECKRASIPVLGPDVNESYYKFTVNNEGAIRFGMGAVKGVGSGAVKVLVRERKNNGKFTSIFDISRRVDLRTVNKKSLDNLILAGGLDSFGKHRAQYYATDEKGIMLLEKAIKYGLKYQENKNSVQVSLFEESSEAQLLEPVIPITKKWNTMELLLREKEVVGIYISGHPLDDFKPELEYFCNIELSAFQNMEELLNRDLAFGGVLTSVQHRISKNGKGWASFILEDYNSGYEFRLFGEEYLKFKHFLVPNSFLFLKASCKLGWDDKPRLGFTYVQLLQDIMDLFAKKVTIKICIDEISEKRILELNDIIKRYKGEHDLNFIVYDVKEKVKLDMASRRIKVRINQDLLKDLNQSFFKYKIN